MVLQYFILGRNPELSKLEIESYCTARNIPYKEIDLSENHLLAEVKKEINIQELGGTLKSGLIEKEGREDEVEGYIISNELIEEDKFTYGLFGNCEPDIFKFKFKSEKRKAMLKHGRTQLKFQDKQKANIPKGDYYLILHKKEDEFYYGIINQEYDTKEIEKRDMKKPIRREHLAISPRLAKILINLAEVKEDDTVLDPFCGIGGIVQEALLKKINAWGSDVDPVAIYGARKNITWLQKTYNIKQKYTVEQKDVRNIQNKQFDGIATETPLGEVLRKQPQDNKAKQMIEKFERFIIPVLRNLKKVKKRNACIAITFPKIKNHAVNYENVCEETGLIISKGPITESRNKQFVARDIIIFK